MIVSLLLSSSHNNLPSSFLHSTVQWQAWWVASQWLQTIRRPLPPPASSSIATTPVLWHRGDTNPWPSATGAQLITRGTPPAHHHTRIPTQATRWMELSTIPMELTLLVGRLVFLQQLTVWSPMCEVYGPVTIVTNNNLSILIISSQY